MLHKAARTRQIVVFTHDDRLPEAIRRLRLDATMLHVDRRARSAVAVQTSRSPVQRYLDGARGYARSDRLPPEVQARVVPMFCRNAVEAAAANLDPHAAPPRTAPTSHEADEQIAEARSLRETLALVLFGDAGRQGEVGARDQAPPRRRPPPRSSPSSTRAPTATSSTPTTLQRLPDATRNLIADLSTMSLSVKHVLDEAERQLDEFDPHTSGAWPHAVRGADPPVPGVHARRLLAHEGAGHDRRPRPATSGSACPPSSATSRSPRAADFAWSTLSNACHHRAYDVGLTQEELRTHLATARSFLTLVAE